MKRDTERRVMRAMATLFVASGILLAGCDQSTPSANVAKGGSPPEVVSVAAGGLTVGFASGVQRQDTTVASYRITKHPITVRDYKACVDGGSCAAPAKSCGQGGGLLDRSTYGDPDALDAPVTCTTPEQATAYCQWTGGRLPRATEWLLAARGPSVQKHPWGSESATCATHPIVEGILADSLSCCAGIDGCSSISLARVGTHGAGASALGLEDVLFAGGEMVTPDGAVPITACGGKGSVCAVSGRAGAIESIVSWRDPADLSVTFRCAYEEASR